MELADYLRVLRKRVWIAAGTLAVFVAGASVATALSTPVYEARSKLFVGQRQIPTTDVAQGATVTLLSQQLLKSYAAIIQTRPISERAVERESLPLSPSELSDHLSVHPILDTQLIQLSYQSTDPALAQRAVNAIAQAFVDEVERIEAPRTQNAEPAVKVAVVEPALRPGSPVRPRPQRNLAFAFVLGSLVGAGLAMLVEYLDTTVKSREEVESQLGIPLLATIPKIDTRAGEVHLERDSQSAGSEAFRKLRTAIQFLGVDRPVQAVLVSSPIAEDGKTTTALNLAAAFAQAGVRTILVEADLRRPVLHKVFSSDGQRGLTLCLVGRVPLDQAILPTPVRNLQHVPAGAVPPNPAELLASEHMADVLRQLRERADVVIIDAPPLLPVADASAIAPRADGVVLVARAGNTHRERLREASELVAKVGGRMLGIVLNCVKTEGSRYDYYYVYGRAKGTPFQTARGPQRLGVAAERPGAPRASSS